VNQAESLSSITVATSARRPALFTAGGLALLASSAMALKFLPAPFIWIGWGWSFALVACALKSERSATRAVFFNIAVLPVLLAGTETYLTLHVPVRRFYSDGYFLPDDALGTAPARGMVGHSTEYEHGKLAYDVAYTIDSDGLRVAPPLNARAAVTSVLFLGCSFTFGEGLQDDQTLPYQVGEQSGGRYAIYNFSFHGYAPNQMLAAIESGRVQQTARIPPRYIVYTALPDHIARVAGKIPYGKHSPRYRLQPDGSVQRAGHFDDDEKQRSRFTASLAGNLLKSAIYRWIASIQPHTNENDLHLFLALVRQSRDRLKAEYPGADFHVILWRNFPYEQETYDKMQAGFAQMNIPTHLIENILPGYNANPQQYWITAENAHPNALANRLIARYVVSEILSH
jgi:hypothetical protein